MNRFVVSALMIFALSSCHQGQNGDLYLKDVVITDRLYSPDSNFVAFIYYIDNGAMGESRSMASVLQVGDTLGPLDNGRLPCKDLPFNACYYPDRWIDGKTLQVTLNEISFVKAGLPFDSTAIKVNGVDCKVVPYDNSERRTPLIRHLSFSDDRKKILVMYQYVGDDLNISVVKYGDGLPKYGNLVAIPPANFNPILYAAWRGDDVALYMRDPRMYKLSDYVNKGAACKVEFADVEGLKVVPADSVLYKDARIDSLLKKEGVTAKGVVTRSLWRMKDDKSLFSCEYKYVVAGQKFRTAFEDFRDYKDGPRYKPGDSVEVSYDPKAPFIHKDAVVSLR